MERRIKTGIIWGLLGTLAMTVIMLIGKATGLAPMPRPIPLAIAAAILGKVSKPVLILFALITHFGYGAFWAVAAARVRWPLGIKAGLALGVGLWLLMQVVVLPLLGWGVFGMKVTGFPPKIAIATLVLHLVYGLVVGVGFSRASRESSPTGPEPGEVT